MTQSAPISRPATPVRVAQMHAVLDAIISVGSLWLRSDIRWRAPFYKESHEPMFVLSAVLKFGGRTSGITVLSIDHEPAQFVAGALFGRPLRDLPDLAVPIEMFARMIAAEAEPALARLGTRVDDVEVLIGKSRCLGFPPGVQPLCVPLDTARGPLAIEFGLVD